MAEMETVVITSTNFKSAVTVAVAVAEVGAEVGGEA